MRHKDIADRVYARIGINKNRDGRLGMILSGIFMCPANYLTCTEHQPTIDNQAIAHV
jgi:hypothetical protein